MTVKVHAVNKKDISKSVCGRFIESSHLTEKESQVTCKLCIHNISWLNLKKNARRL